MTRPLLQIFLVAGIMAGAGTAAMASPLPALPLPAADALACSFGVGENCEGVQFVQASCGGAAAAAAAQHGGQVIGAPRAVQQGGQTVCVVTILIRDPSGQRPPVKKQITVPAR